VISAGAARVEEAAAELRTAGKGTVTTQVCDIRDAAAVERWSSTRGARGRSTVWSTMPPAFHRAPESLSPRAVDAVLGIVLHGAAYATLACGRRWIAARRPAAVLSIVTTYAWTGSGYVLPSAMAKAGVLAMTRSLAVEWGRHGVRLNAIAPGPFPTKGAWERLAPRPDIKDEFERRNALGRVGRHEELADLAAFLMSDARATSPATASPSTAANGSRAPASSTSSSGSPTPSGGVAAEESVSLEPGPAAAYL